MITLFTNGKSLAPATVNANSLHVSQNGTILNGTIAVLGDNHAIEFTPSAAFNAGATVQIFLDGTIQDVDGNFLAAYQGQFTIAGNAATVQPTVIARNPAYGTAGVALNVIPRIAVDQTLDPTTVTTTNVTIYDGTLGAYLSGGTVSLVGSNNNVIQVRPASNLAASHTFYVYLNNVKNAAGLAVLNSYYEYFTTGTAADTTTPTVTAVSPIDATSSIGTNALIVIQFSKVMDPISITSATIQVTGGSQTVVPVSVSLDPTTRFVNLTPQAPLPANTLMTLAINGVTDPEGNLVTPKTTHFTTGPGPDITPASVLYFSPEFNTSNVPTNTSIVVQWNKQMNTATIYDQPGTGTYLYDSVTGLHVPGTIAFSSDLTTATFVPSAPLLVNRAYYFYAYGALDLTGNPAANNYTYFTTSYLTSTTVPQVLNSNPENTVTGVAVNTPIQVLFNEPIEPQSTKLVQLMQGGTPVPVTTTISEGSTLAHLDSERPVAA